jgi:D-alanine-D-alanine ligase
MLNGKKIAVLKGGPGSERKVSLASAAGVEKALVELGAEVFPIDVQDDSFVVPEGIDLAFNVIHGTMGEDGRLQRILEERGIPYTGEGVRGSEIAFDKIETKKVFAEHRVSTPGFEILAVGERTTLPLPYVVKAPREGSSVGVFIVKTEDEVESAFEGVKAYADRVLVEEFVLGRELTVGVVGGEALPIIEICPKQGFYDFNNKYPFLNPGGGGAADHYCPAAIPDDLTREIQALALEAQAALGLEVYCRVDVLLPESGAPSVIEINTIPGMTETSLLPEAAAAAGISYRELCERIIQLSFARFSR